MLKIQVDGNAENDLLFTDFEDAIEMLNFIKVFKGHCKTVCEYNIADSEIYE